MKKKIKYSLIVLFILFCIDLVIRFTWSERVLPFAPEADTQYTSGYSAENYDKIKPGMTEQEVLSVLGQPFSIDTLNQYWRKERHVFYSMSYSKDGACWFGDFAWMIRDVHLDSTRHVVEAVKSIAYD